MFMKLICSFILGSFLLLISSCGHRTIQTDQTIDMAMTENANANDISRVPAVESSGKECLKLVSMAVRTENASTSVLERSLDEFYSQFELKTGLKLNFEQKLDFENIFKEENFDIYDFNTLKSIMLYSGNDHAIRMRLLNSFKDSILSKYGETIADNEWETFKRHQQRVESRVKSILEKKAEGKFNPKRSAEIFEKLYYQCKTQIKTNIGNESTVQAQAKKLTFALTAGAVFATVGSYSLANWKYEKDEKWFKELAFSTAITTVFTYLGGKHVLANDKLNNWTQKAPLNFLFKALGDVGISAVYGMFFNLSEEEANKKIEAIKSDPQAIEKMNELLEIAKNEGIYEKHAKAVERLFINKKTGKAFSEKSFPQDITIDDVDLEASREFLMESIATKEYLDNKGMLSTGSVETDRFAYHRIGDFLFVPSSIALSLLMKNQICMLSEHPKKAFAIAVLTYTIANIALDYVYFLGKKQLINQ